MASFYIEIPSIVADNGLPIGGTTNQVLSKVSGADFDTQWVTISGGSANWGFIGGVLSNQTDLQTALNAKVDENAPIAGATKTKITYDSQGLVTSGADATTSDVNDSTNRRYVTDAQLVIIGNTSGTNTGDQNLSALALKATTIATNYPLAGGGDLSANRTLSIPLATNSVDGYLSAADRTAFNAKQNALGFTPENIVNKATSLASPDNTKYPTTLAVTTESALKVSKSGDTMSGLLTLPSIKLKNGSNELDGSFSGPAWNLFTNQWLVFSSGDYMVFNSQIGLQFNCSISGSGANFDQFGGVSFNAGPGGYVSLNEQSGSNVFVDAAGVKLDSPGAQIQTVSAAGTVIRDSTNDNTISVSNDGSIYLTAAGVSGDVWSDASINIKNFFGSAGSGDFSVFNNNTGASPIIASYSGQLDLSSAGAQNISLLSSSDILLSGGNTNFECNANPNLDGSYTLGNSSFRWDQIYGYFANIGNVLVSGTLGAGYLQLESQNGAVPAPGSGVRVYSDNTNYPVFKDPSNRAFTFSLNSITANTNIELIVPNTNGTIATQAYVTANSVQTSNVTFSTFVSSLGTFNLSNAYLNSFTGTTATWSLPSNVSGLPGRSYKIKNRGSGNLTINVVGGGSTIYTTAVVSSFVIAAGGSVDIISDGTYWLST